MGDTLSQEVSGEDMFEVAALVCRVLGARFGQLEIILDHRNILDEISNRVVAESQSVNRRCHSDKRWMYSGRPGKHYGVLYRTLSSKGLHS